MAFFLQLGAKPASSFVMPARLNTAQYAAPPSSAASFIAQPPAAASAPPAAAPATSAKAGARERQYTEEQVRNAARRILASARRGSPLAATTACQLEGSTAMRRRVVVGLMARIWDGFGAYMVNV